MSNAIPVLTDAGLDRCEKRLQEAGRIMETLFHRPEKIHPFVGYYESDVMELLREVRRLRAALLASQRKEVEPHEP